MATRTFGRLCPCLPLAALVFLTACASTPRSRYDNPAQREYDQGLTHYNLGETSEAIEALEHATLLVSRGEFKADVEYQLARCYLEVGRYVEAAEHFAVARAHTDRRLQLFRIWTGLGEAHYRMGDYQQAAGAFRESLLHESDALFLDEVHYKLAVSLRRSGQVDEAERMIARVRSYTPGVGEPRYGEGAGPAATPGADDDWRGLPASISTRSEWGARPVRSNHDPMAPIHRMTIHHSALVSDALSKGEVAREIRDIQRTHQDGRHWADIGYHFVIDRGGRIWEGRSIDLQGAHAGNSDLNRGNVGIVLLGDFNVQAVNREQSHSLRMLMLYLMECYGVSADAVHTHGELKNTQCPGADLQAEVVRLRSELHSAPLSKHVAFKSEIRHLVERGETLFSIAKRYGVKVTDLRGANAKYDDDLIEGDELLIPASGNEF